MIAAHKILPCCWHGFSENQHADIAAQEAKPPKGVKPPVRIVIYECGQCGEPHDNYEDAEECCAELEDEDDAIHCPVCGDKAATHRDAADHFLWKDLDAQTRWDIADAVQAGGAWGAEIMSAIGMRGK